MLLLPRVAAFLLAMAIIAIGVMYVEKPRAAARSFGLPSPDAGANTDWWLRLKGVRDIASGVVVLTMMAWGGPRAIGLALAAEALIPTGDMLTILAARGSVARAVGMHGLTAVVMLTAAVPLLIVPA